MNKILALALIFTSLYGISTLPVNAQAVFGPSQSAAVPNPNYQPVSCGNTSNGTYGCLLLPACVQNQSMYSTSCRCPDGATYTGMYGSYPQCSWSTNYLPTCIQSTSGMSYITVAVQCQCPNGTTVWSNGGYTNQCQSHPTYTCWDGTSPMPGQSCPTQTKVCSNGSVISAYQTCPVQPTCSYYQYWNGYQCVNMYQTIPYQQTQYQYYPYNGYQQSTNWFNQNNATNFGYSYSNGVWTPATGW